MQYLEIFVGVKVIVVEQNLITTQRQTRKRGSLSDLRFTRYYSETPVTFKLAPKMAEQMAAVGAEGEP